MYHVESEGKVARYPSVLWQLVKCKYVTTRNSKHRRLVSGWLKNTPNLCKQGYFK